jgi:hypothetical protein
VFEEDLAGCHRNNFRFSRRVSKGQNEAHMGFHLDCRGFAASRPPVIRYEVQSLKVRAFVGERTKR